MDLITFECSSCRQILKVGADKVGRQAKCPRCATTLLIPSSSTVVEPGPAPPQPKRPPSDDEEIIAPRASKGGSARRRDEDDEDDDRPRRRRRDEEDEEEDERPRRRRRDEVDDEDDDRPRRRRRRDEDDEEDERPRRRRRDEDDDDYDRPRRKGMSAASRWSKVQVGILIVAIAACVMTATWAVYLIGDLIALIGIIMLSSGNISGGGWVNTSLTFAKIGVIIGLLASVGSIVGYVFNIFVPNKRGALGLAIAIIVLAVVDLVLSIIFKVIPVFSARGDLFFGGGSTNEVVALIFGLLLPLVFGAEFILLYLLMANVSNQWKQRGQARDCINLMILVSVGAGLMALSVLMTYIGIKTATRTTAGLPAMMWVGIILKILADIALVGVFAWSIAVLFRTKDVID